MVNHQYIYILIEEHEDWLIERVIYYTKLYNYTKYTSTLRKDWRASIAGLSKSFLKSLQTAGIPGLGPDENFIQDPIASFAILEAQRHRAHGVSLGMFLCAMKSSYRQSYIDLVCQAGFARDYEEYCRHLIERFFDRVEIRFCRAWLEFAESKEDIKQTPVELQAIFRALPDLYLRLDLAGTILDIRGCSSDLYLPVEEVIRKKIYDLLPSPVGEQVLQAIKQALQTKSLVMIEYPLTLKDKEHSFEARILPLHESQVISIIRNITKRKRAEELLRKSQEQLRSLTAKFFLIEEKERRRIATDIHDYIGQTLAVTKMKLGSLQKSLISTPLTNNVDEIRQLIDEAIHYTRSLTFELSPPILYDLGFEAALEWLGEQLHERHGMQFSIESNNQLKPMNDEIRIILFQAVRELLFNIVKHAKAQRVDIFIQNHDKNIWIEVVDDGIGFDTLESKNSGKIDGFGLFSIRERLKHLGGCLKIQSNPGHGTRIVLETPLLLDS